MTGSARRWLLAGLAAMATVAWACGPDFPEPILSRREAALYSTPYRSFALESAALARAGDALTARESEQDRAPVAEEKEGPAYATVRAMRRAATGDEAYALGAGVAEAIRLYTAGAVDFRLAHPMRATGDDDADRNDGDGTGPSPAEPPPRLPPLNAAIARFSAVLALPAAASAPRATWAAYMLGRSYALRAAAGDGARAAAAFARTRRLALDGAPDPLGLAVASFGEEARLALGQGHTAEAVRLYAEQASRGSRSGQDSLRVVARRLFGDPAHLPAQLQDATVRRLLVSHAVEVLEAERGVDPGTAEGTREPPPYVIGIRAHQATAEVLLTALERSGLTDVEGLDEVAALAYSAGQFELAGRCATRAPSLLGQAVLAKLAVRRGDRAAALTAYASLVDALRRQPDAPAGRLDEPTARALVAEHGVLLVARGDYLAALTTLVQAGGDYWFDAAYLAERVLSSTELRSVVDTLPTLAPHEDERSELPTAGRRNALRQLLARRLMREGRYDLAFRYFAGQTAGRDQSVALEPLARRYAAALASAGSRWTAVGRAEARFEAATLARRYGMELLGYELEPDMAVFDGALQWSVIDTRGNKPDPYAGPDESTRRAATEPANLRRFHYRTVAATLAGQAADELPHRSQAFAAVLCTAAGWMRDGPEGDPARERALYDRYRRQGPHVRWAVNFGRQCQAPDFTRAAADARREAWHSVRHGLRRFRAAILSLMAIVVAIVVASGVALLVSRRRRARMASGPP